MNIFRFVLLGLGAISVLGTCRADTVTFEVAVAQDTVAAGSIVDWELFVTVTDADATNFGIDSLAVNMMDSFGEVLSPGNVGGLGNPFATYAPSGGVFDTETKQLLDVGALLIFQNSSAAANVSAGGDQGPLLLASGSYKAFELGNHTLSVVPGFPNQYFTAPGQLTGLGNPFETTVVIPDSFNVTGVPEPSTFSLGLVATGISYLTIRRKRRPKKTLFYRWIRRIRRSPRALIFGGSSPQ